MLRLERVARDRGTGGQWRERGLRSRGAADGRSSDPGESKNHAEDRVEVRGVGLGEKQRRDRVAGERGNEDLREDGSSPNSESPNACQRPERSPQQEEKQHQAEDAELRADLDKRVVSCGPLEAVAVAVPRTLSTFGRQGALGD